MNVVVVEPGYLPYEKEINGLSEMQAIVGGYITATYPYENEAVSIVANDEGLLLNLPFNRSIPGGYGGIFGTFFICGIEEDRFCSLTPEQIERFKQEYKYAEILLGASGNVPVTLKVQAKPKPAAEKEHHAQPEPDTAEKVKALTDKLETGVKAVFESEQYKAYMKAMAKFHRYSFNNVMLILMQCPNATAVAGFNTWKRQFGRTVKKGESGIQILAPVPYKRIVENVKLDPVTKAPVLDANGRPVTETEYVVQQSYKIAYVFDVSQTEGRELPSYGVEELTGNVQNYDAMLKAITELAPVPVVFSEPDSNARGRYVHSEQRIYLDSGMSQIDTISILIHETAHAILHALPVKDGVVVGVPEKSRRTREVEAESIAYIVCQHFGIETGDSAFAYITRWSRDKELEELKTSLDCISRTSAEMIDAIESCIPDLSKSQDKPEISEKYFSR